MFLVRPIPAELEGPNAFALRVAKENCLSVRQVLQVGIWHTWPGVQESFDRLRPLSRRSAAFCPKCLGDGGIGLAVWELTFADACPRCGSWLVDSCGGCGATQTWQRADLEHCACGQRLAEQSCVPAPPALFELCRRFEHCLSSQHECDHWASHLDVVQLSALTRLIGCYGLSQGYRQPQKGQFAAELRASWGVSTIAAEALSEWPHSFHLFLGVLSQRPTDSTKAGSLPRVFGGFYTALYRAFKAPVFDELRGQFERFVLEHWTGALGKRNRRFREHLLERGHWLPANHVCEVAGVSRRRLEDLVASGDVRGESRTTVAGRTFTVVHRDSVKHLKAAVESELTLVDAATRLGFKRSRFAAILSTICPQARRQVDELTPWSIPGAWVEDWLARVERFEQLSERTDAIALMDVLRYWAWSDARIAQLLLDVVAGNVLPLGRIDGVDGIPSMAFSESDLRAWLAKEQTNPGTLTVPAAAARLGIKQEVAYLIVRRGLLASTTRRMSSRSASVVGEVDLQRFRERYVWARDVAAALKRSPKAVVAGLVLAGATPVSGPQIDGGRQLLFERKEVEALLQRSL